MYMTKIGTRAGVLLILFALFGYFGSGAQSWTALIPSFFGIPILIGSLVGRNPDKLKLGMHIAALFGLLGFLAPLGRVVPGLIKGTFVFNLAGTLMIAMTVVCAVFLFLCVRYFIEVRKKR